MWYLRRVVGGSMAPTLKENQIVLVRPKLRRLKPGDIVVVKHDGREKIKRLNKLDGRMVYILGDNAPASTDSRHFGWLELIAVQGKVIWPRKRKQQHQHQKSPSA